MSDQRKDTTLKNNISQKEVVRQYIFAMERYHDAFSTIFDQLECDVFENTKLIKGIPLIIKNTEVLKLLFEAFRLTFFNLTDLASKEVNE